MNKPYQRLQSIKAFRNKYLAVAITAAFLTISLFASAQYDSTKSSKYTPVGGYGHIFQNIEMAGPKFKLYGDTVHLAFRDSNSVAVKNRNLFLWVGTYWKMIGSGGTSNVGDSLARLFDTAQAHTARMDTLRKVFFSRDSSINASYSADWDTVFAEVDTNKIATKIFVTNIINGDTSAHTDPLAIQSIRAVSDSSFENTHGDGSIDTVVIKGIGGSGGITANQLGFIPITPQRNDKPLFSDTSWTTSTSNTWLASGASVTISGNKPVVTGSGTTLNKLYFKNIPCYIERREIIDTIQINSSPAANHGIFIGSMSTSMILNGFKLDLSTGIDAGKIIFKTIGDSTKSISTSSIAFSNGDILELRQKRARDTLFANVKNITTGLSISHSYIMVNALMYDSVMAENIGYYGIAVTGGASYKIISSSVMMQELMYATLEVGSTSIGQGYWAGTWNNRLVDKLTAGYCYTTGSGSAGDKVYDIQSRIHISGKLKPLQVLLLSTAANQLREGQTIDNVFSNVKTLVSQYEALGSKVIIMNTYENSPIYLIRNKIITLDSLLKIEYPDKYIDGITTTKNHANTLYNPDSIHLNSVGNDSLYQLIVRSGLIAKSIYRTSFVPDVIQNIKNQNVADSLGIVHIEGNQVKSGLLNIGTTNNADVAIKLANKVRIRFHYNTGTQPIGEFYTWGGTSTGLLRTDSLGNTAFGNAAGINCTSGFSNTYIGDRPSGYNAAGSSFNTCVGSSTGGGITPSSVRSRQTLIGYAAGYWDNRSDIVYFGYSNNQAPLFFGLSSTNQICINPAFTASTRSEVDASAQLEIYSTNRGLLIPRLTTTQRDAIISPATSLLVYNTTLDSFQYYKSGWKTLGGASGGSGITTGQLTDSLNGRAALKKNLSDSAGLGINTGYSTGYAVQKKIDSTNANIKIPLSSTVSVQDTTVITVAKNSSMSISVLANKKYKVEFTLYTSCDTTTGIMVGLSGPSGSAVSSGSLIGSNASNGAPQIGRPGVMGSLSGGGVLAFNRATGLAGILQGTIFITTSSTPGTLTLIFAAATLTTAKPVYIQVGSTMEVTENQ